MAEALVAFFKEDWGTKASIFVTITLGSALVCALFRRKMPEIANVALVLFGAAGFASGIKILMLTLCLKSDQLGPLGDDKPTLMLGGFVAIVVAANEMLTKWVKVAKP